MPDNRIDIQINLRAAEGEQQLQRLKSQIQELKYSLAGVVSANEQLAASSARVINQYGMYSGGIYLQKQETALLQERIRYTNELAAAEAKLGQVRSAMNPAAVEAAAKRQADIQIRESERAAAASQKARIADYNSWLDQQRKLEKGQAEQEKRAEQFAHRGIFTATQPGLVNFRDFENIEYRLKRFRAEQEASEGIGGGFLGRTLGRLNRQGALEAQAAVVNTVQALASGMNPLHVAMMEGTQLAGAAVQGNLISLKTVFNALTSPIGLAVAGLTALTGVIAAVATSAVRASNQLTAGINIAAFQGRDSGAVRANIEGLIETIRTSSGLGRVESRTGGITIGGIPNISNETRESLARSYAATAYGMFNEDTEKANKFFEGFSSPEKLKALNDEFGLITGNARETFNAAISIGDGLTASSMAAAALEERVRAFAQAMKDARTEQGTIGRTLDILGWGYAARLANRTGSTSWWNPVPGLFTSEFKPSTLAPSEGERKATQAADRQLKIEEEINGLIQQRQSLLNQLNQDEGNPRLERALTEVNEQIAKAHTPEEERRHNARLSNLESELAAARRAASNDQSQYTRVAEIIKQIEEEKTNFVRSEAAKREGIHNKESQAEVDAARAAAEELHQIEMSKLQVRLQQGQLQRAQIGPANLSGQHTVLQQELADMQATKAEETAIIGKKTEIVNLERQIRLEGENIRIAQSQQAEVIAQSGEDLVTVLSLRRQEAELIQKSNDRSPIEKVQAQTKVIQTQMEMLQRARQLEIQNVDSANQAQQRRLQTLTSFANLQVQAGNATTEQAIAAEKQLSTTYTNEAAGRLEQLRNNSNLTRSERIRVNEQLSQLYEQDAQKQIELQSRLTLAIRAENEKRVENFKNFFSSVESASASLLTAGLLKSQTRQEALKSFRDSIVTSFVGEAEKMASKFAGKGLASVFGVKLGEDEDSSISNVLAKSVGSWLGLTKNEPKIGQAEIANRMQQASEAQKRAGDLMLQAAQELSAAVGKISTSPITSTAASRVPSAFEGQYTQGIGSSNAVEHALDMIERDESGGRNIRNFKFDKTHTASGYFQITDTTWKEFDTANSRAYSTAMSAPYDIQREVARNILTTSGIQHWASWNAPLASNLRKEGFPTTGIIKVDPDSVAQGVIKGQQTDAQLTRTNSGNLSDLNTTTTDQIQTTKDLIQSNRDLKQKEGTSGSSSSGSAATTDNAKSGLDTWQSGLNTFSSAMAVVSSAALLFGKDLSSTGKKIIGGIGVVSGLMSFAVNAVKFGALFLEGGGIIPSAAGGMVVDNKGGTLGVLHPREMVLPAGLSSGLQNLITSGQTFESNNSTANNTTNNLSYAPQYRGYHPYQSKKSVGDLMRRHGSEMMKWVEAELSTGRYKPA